MAKEVKKITKEEAKKVAQNILEKNTKAEVVYIRENGLSYYYDPGKIVDNLKTFSFKREDFKNVKKAEAEAEAKKKAEEEAKKKAEAEAKKQTK